MLERKVTLELSSDEALVLLAWLRRFNQAEGHAFEDQAEQLSGFMSSCGFVMPAVSASDYQKYNNFTLSIVQILNINDKVNASCTAPIQSASVSNVVAQNVIWSATGKYPRQTLMISLDKAALLGAGTYQPLFQIASGVAGGGFPGWQIESIAVNGLP